MARQQEKGWHKAVRELAALGLWVLAVYTVISLVAYDAGCEHNLGGGGWRSSTNPRTRLWSCLVRRSPVTRVARMVRLDRNQNSFVRTVHNWRNDFAGSTQRESRQFPGTVAPHCCIVDHSERIACLFEFQRIQFRCANRHHLCAGVARPARSTTDCGDIERRTHPRTLRFWTRAK